MKPSESVLPGLMAAAQSGDKAAYHALLSACDPWLRRYFSGRIAPSDVDDLVQETLVSLHRKRGTYDPARPFLPWLAAIARYRWIDRLRRTYRDAADELPETLGVESHEEEIGARIGIDRLLARLPEGQALAIRLVKIDGLSVAEAAERSSQSEALIKVNVHRGLKRLSALVESE